MIRGSAHWLSQDRLGFGAGDDDLYRYVFNSTTAGTDPKGLDIEFKNEVFSPRPFVMLWVFPILTFEAGTKYNIQIDAHASLSGEIIALRQIFPDNLNLEWIQYEISFTVWKYLDKPPYRQQVDSDFAILVLSPWDVRKYSDKATLKVNGTAEFRWHHVELSYRIVTKKIGEPVRYSGDIGARGYYVAGLRYDDSNLLRQAGGGPDGPRRPLR